VAKWDSFVCNFAAILSRCFCTIFWGSKCFVPRSLFSKFGCGFNAFQLGFFCKSNDMCEIEDFELLELCPVITYDRAENVLVN